MICLAKCSKFALYLFVECLLYSYMFVKFVYFTYVHNIYTYATCMYSACRPISVLKNNWFPSSLWSLIEFAFYISCSKFCFTNPLFEIRILSNCVGRLSLRMVIFPLVLALFSFSLPFFFYCSLPTISDTFTCTHQISAAVVAQLRTFRGFGNAPIVNSSLHSNRSYCVKS